MSKYIFLKNKESWTQKQSAKFESINSANLVTAKAWQLKENFKGFYFQGTAKECHKIELARYDDKNTS